MTRPSTLTSRTTPSFPTNTPVSECTSLSVPGHRKLVQPWGAKHKEVVITPLLLRRSTWYQTNQHHGSRPTGNSNMSKILTQEHAQATTNHHNVSFPEIRTYSTRSLKDPTTQSLAKCLQKNHTTFSALRDPQLLFHNHMPHVRQILTLSLVY